ncbi:MAG: choice-of-anchor A family protein [Methylococcales bacterium]|nr:choice-of-anchor A family protein [Methylococcales bacterium]
MKRHKNKLLTTTLFLTGLFAFTGADANLLDLGVAGQFNAYILGDMSASNSDVQGTLAVGGNLTLNNYGIGQSLTSSQNGLDSVIAGGTMSITNARIYYGNAVSGIQSSLDNSVGFYNDPYTNNTIGGYRTGSPIDFASVNQDLINTSANWGGVAANGTSVTENSWGNLTLSGSNTGVNIFDLTAQELAGASSFWLDIPDNAYALINVDGANVSMSNFGFYRTVNGQRVQVADGGLDRFLTQTVLFNLFSATSLTMDAVGIEGSLLAPLAATTFYNGQIDGNLIVGSLNAPPAGYNTGQVNDVPLLVPPFAPSTISGKSASSQVPEPPVIFLLFPYLIFLAFKKHRIGRF